MDLVTDLVMDLEMDQAMDPATVPATVAAMATVMGPEPGLVMAMDPTMMMLPVAAATTTTMAAQMAPVMPVPMGMMHLALPSRWLPAMVVCAHRIRINEPVVLH